MLNKHEWCTSVKKANAKSNNHHFKICRWCAYRSTLCRVKPCYCYIADRILETHCDFSLIQVSFYAVSDVTCLWLWITSRHFFFLNVFVSMFVNLDFQRSVIFSFNKHSGQNGDKMTNNMNADNEMQWQAEKYMGFKLLAHIQQVSSDRVAVHCSR